jgi:ABC-type branched-subunit amino acid transport system substrate-binding protein
MRDPIGFVQKLAQRATALLAAAAVVFLSACESTNVPDHAQATQHPATAGYQPFEALMAPPKTPRVALLLPLTGSYASLGTAMLQAAEMAFFDIADQDFVLLPRDTGGTPEGAARAAEEALADGAALILGPLFSASVGAVAPIARSRGVNVISFSTNPHIAGGGVFVMGFLSRDQIDRVVQHSLISGLWRFGALVPNSPYGQQVAAEFQESVQQQGGQLTRLEFYDPGLADNSEVVRRFADYASRGVELKKQIAGLKGQDTEEAKAELRRLEVADTAGELPFDAVLLPVGGQSLVSIAPLLPYYDVDPTVVRFLGTGQWDAPGLGREPALVGGWFAAPDPAGRASFESRYEAVFGAAPPRLATLAYDATALSAVLAGRPGGPDFTFQALTVVDGFAGIDGLFRFNPDGRVERSLAVLQVGRNDATMISPPPSFLSLTE